MTENKTVEDPVECFDCKELFRPSLPIAVNHPTDKCEQITCLTPTTVTSTIVWVRLIVPAMAHGEISGVDHKDFHLCPLCYNLTMFELYIGHCLQGDHS